MEENLKTAEGILTLVKFHTNQDIDSTRNSVISRTLGKFGVVSGSYTGEIPKPEEFWVCRIIKNIKPDLTQGCFVLEPLKKVSYQKSVGKLLKNMYDVNSISPVITIIEPKEEFKNHVWQLSLEDRKTFKGQAVVVKLHESVLDDRENEDVSNN